MKTKEQIEAKIAFFKSCQKSGDDPTYDADDDYVLSARIAILEWVLQP